MQGTYYVVRNVAKSAATKIRRYIEPGRARQKQFLGPYRLLHNQQLRLTSSDYEKFRDTILERVRCGIFQVTTPDGGQIYADHQGVLKIRKGQDIQDLPYSRYPATVTPPPLGVVNIAAAQVDTFEEITKPGVEPAEVPDLSDAYSFTESNPVPPTNVPVPALEPVVSPVSGGTKHDLGHKKGKRR